MALHMSEHLEITAKLKELRAKSSAVSDAASSSKDLEVQRIPVEYVRVEPSSRLVAHLEPYSPAADKFRLIRLRLQELWNAGKLKTLLITSALPQDGKSTTALNLATSLAHTGKRILLVEGDLYNPSLGEKLGVPPRAGLAECLENGLNPMSALRLLEPLGWYLMSAGSTSRTPTELFQPEALEAILQKLQSQFDWVLIDSPPVVPLTDALVLARHVDATLLIARNGKTPREAIAKAISYVGRQRILGVVLNGVEKREQAYGGYGYYGSPYGNAKQPVSTPDAIAAIDRPALKDGGNQPAVRNGHE